MIQQLRQLLTRLVRDVGLNEVVRPRHVLFVQDLRDKQEDNFQSHGQSQSG